MPDRRFRQAVLCPGPSLAGLTAAAPVSFLVPFLHLSQEARLSATQYARPTGCSCPWVLLLTAGAAGDRSRTDRTRKVPRWTAGFNGRCPVGGTGGAGLAAAAPVPASAPVPVCPAGGGAGTGRGHRVRNGAKAKGSDPAAAACSASSPGYPASRQTDPMLATSDRVLGKSNETPATSDRAPGTSSPPPGTSDRARGINWQAPVARDWALGTSYRALGTSD